MPTIPQPIKDEILLVVRGVAGAVLAGALMGFVNYVGAHTSDIMNFIVTIGGGYIGVKTKT